MTGTRIYELPWKYHDRVATGHLGAQHYPTSVKALQELVANSFDAGAAIVEIDIAVNEIGFIECLTISDNGRGISPSELENRFMLVGVLPPSTKSPSHLGRFGIGRLAVHRIGSVSKWSSVSATNSEHKTKITFTLDDNISVPLKVLEETTSLSESSGTTIQIYNVLDSGTDCLNETRISQDLLTQFCSYLIAHPDRQIRVQGNPLDVSSLIQSSKTEKIPASDDFPSESELTHLIMRKPISQMRFPHQLLFSARGRTVASVQPDEVPFNEYLGIVECPELESILTSNRESIIELDQGFGYLRQAACQHIKAYGVAYKRKLKKEFIERARNEDFYPYRNTPNDVITSVEKDIYDVVLEKVNDHVNVEAMTKKQRAVIFKLLRRVLENEDLLQVLNEVASLSDDDIEKFRKVLEQTTLSSIIRLSSEVSNRLSFLDLLHILVYADSAKHLKERTQLHKLLEPHCWIFDGRFHLATSDRSFREIIRRHRRMAELDDLDDIDIQKVNGIEDIPDLFLAATRNYPINPKHHHVLVELKAPRVPLGKKERDQVHRYAETIMDSQEFDKQNTRWDIYLISSRVSKEIERDRSQDHRPYGCLYAWHNMTVWAFEWSEVITKSRDEMHLIRDHLKKKSQELSVSDYLRENFPDILEKLSAANGAQATPLTKD